MTTKQGSNADRGYYVERVWESQLDGYAPARYRRPCDYRAYIPYPIRDWVPSLTGSTAGVVSDVESKIHHLNKDSEPTLGPLARLLLRTESIASSKVEGMQTDVRALARAEARRDTGERIGAEALEVLANVDAMQLAVEEAVATQSLERKHIANIHRVLLERTNDRIAGTFRSKQNWIGGNDYNPCEADFVPPPPEEVDQLLDDLVDFCNGEGLPALVQAAIAHAQFETIHPFDDGNGRIGRALVHVVLRRRGLAPGYVPPVSVVLARDRKHYIDALTKFREGDYEAWIEAFGVATAQAADLASDYLEAVEELQERWREQLRDAGAPRADAAAWAVIEVLPAHPVLTAGIGVAATGRSRPAVDLAIRQLSDAGVLRALSDSKRNRAWEAPALLDLLRDLEEGTPLMR